MPTHFRGKASEVRALDLYVKLVRATNTLFARLDPCFAAMELTGNQFGVLEVLLHLGPTSQKELCGKLLTSGGNVTQVVDFLEERGWVRRERDTDDRRLVTVHLTAEGRALIQRLFPPHAAAIAQALAPLSATEQDELARLCKKLGLGLAGKR